MANGNNTVEFIVGVIAGMFGFHFLSKRKRGPGAAGAGGGTSKDAVRRLVNRLHANGKIDDSFYGTAVDFLEDPDSTPEMVLTFIQSHRPGVLPPNGAAPPPPPPDQVVVNVPGGQQPPPMPPECLTDADCVRLYGPNYVCIDGKCVYVGPPDKEPPETQPFPEWDFGGMDITQFPVDPVTGFIMVPDPYGNLVPVDPATMLAASPVQPQNWYDGLDVPANGVIPTDPTTGFALSDEPDYEHAPSQGQDIIASLPKVAIPPTVDAIQPDISAAGPVDTDYLQDAPTLNYDGSHY